MRVLLIEDDEVDRRAVRRALGDAAALTEAVDVPSAIAALDGNHFDCILLDHNLPGESGLDFLRRARECGITAPIILVTGQEDEDMAATTLKAGAADYLSKGGLTPARLQLSMRLARERHDLEIERARLLASEQAARAEAERASHAKDRFLAFVSHELRTPLSAILGWTYLMREGTLEERDAARVPQIIERNARVLAQLVEDLLDVSRMISGKLHIDRQIFHPRRVVKAALDTIQPAAEAKDIEITVNLPGDGPVHGDPNRMQQVFTNLLANAVKFTPEGGKVSVLLETAEDRIVLCVVDDGRGIDPVVLPSIFEPFRQEDNRSVRSGLGLGLAIAQHIVEQHGGSILAESAGAGKGATFRVSIPLAKVDAPIPPADPGVRVMEPGRLDGVSVLVVEDNSETREMLAVLLSSRGADVHKAASAAEALATIAENVPDVMISDIQMPGDDGIALIQALRQGKGGRGTNLPAIALTASTHTEDRSRILAAGFQVHLPKPVEPERLVRLVAALARQPVRA